MLNIFRDSLLQLIRHQLWNTQQIDAGNDILFQIKVLDIGVYQLLKWKMYYKDAVASPSDFNYVRWKNESEQIKE